MKVAVDSHQFPAAMRLETWRRITCDTFVGLDCKFADADFRSVFEGHVAGDYGITRVTSTRRQIDRSPTLIKRDGAEIFFFGLMLAGRGTVVQAGREAILERGSLVFHDATRPSQAEMSDASDLIWLHVPKASLVGCAELEDRTATRFTPSRPVERAVCDVLTGLDQVDDLDLPAQEADRILRQMLDLLVQSIIAGTPGLASSRQWRH